MSIKLHAKSYSNNDRLFFMLNPNEDIAENDPVRVDDSIIENLDSCFRHALPKLPNH